ncbi:MAG: septum formation protein Maf [Candidatus Staskawiczbacteria bacterium RIFCSPHIGHO2_02_FULL_34_9]|uniref:dTTP/UTP pyrophosphatase n=1 Tax=Candidatus Staskawiczbacteria bacterium RIFCSPHIGHO2_02_FULL_34_9 TaxID=1802206 RepID=A0A1G2HZM7_9BACT|nr:MAG: septum formation protein Maf [Candidatus Staskawiczbacteria bacterium RIFCSPHIGHO2_02_FULL_34_9]
MQRKIILASTSPRRKEILAKTGLVFEIQASDYHEDMTLKMSPEKLVEYLSKGKAEAVALKNSNAIVIAADTFVAYKNKKLGKPKDKREAKKMLTMLSGKQNNIISGVTIIDTHSGKSLSFHEITKVFMKKMSADEIENYIATGEPLDKAGAYALQERGSIFIKKIDGDFFNAMGLPLNKLVEKLKMFSVELF